MDETPTNSTDKLNNGKPEKQNSPLFLPIGSVRALMALTVIAAFVAICLYTKNIEALAVITTMIAKDYFEGKKA